MNPGGVIASEQEEETYLQLTHLQLMSFEGFAQSWERMRDTPSYRRSYPVARFAMTTENCTSVEQMRSVIAKAAALHYGSFYVTHQTANYSVLPPYWEDELAMVESLNARHKTDDRCHRSLRDAQLWARQQLPTKHDLVVKLCPGRLTPQRTRFDAADSGSSSGTVIYRGSSTGERTVFDMGVRIHGWKEDAATGIWEAPIPPNVTHSRHVWVDGKRAIRARSDAPLSNTSGTRITNDSYIHVDCNITLEPGMEFVYRPHCASWTQPRCLVESATAVDGATTVRMQSPCFYRYQTRARMTTSSPSIMPVWVENGFSLLDAEREWYADFRERKLYYKPAADEDVTVSEIVLGGSPTGSGSALMEIDGAHHLAFEDIDIRFQTWELPRYIGFVDSQSGFYRSFPRDVVSPWSTSVGVRALPAVVQIHASHDVAVRRCSFRHLGLGGLSTDHGSQRISVFSNAFGDTSAYGISLGNVSNATLPPEKQDRELHVVNNTVANAAVEFTGCAAVFGGYISKGNISHNVVSNASNCGLCVGWGWGANNTMERNSITHNHVLRSNTVLKDTGSICECVRVSESICMCV